MENKSGHKVKPSLEKLWEQCQITYDGVRYNLATDDFYKYIDHVIANAKKSNP